MVGMRSELPLLFDGIIGKVGYDSTSNTDDHNHFPRELNVGQEGRLMSERWLSVDEIAANLRVHSDAIFNGITRKRMSAHKFVRMWKFFASESEFNAADVGSREASRHYSRDTFGECCRGHCQRFIIFLEWLAPLGSGEGIKERGTKFRAIRILDGLLRNGQT